PKGVVRQKERPLLEDAGGVLDAFYASLWRTEKREEGAVTRIVHYGDSPTTADLITGDVRAQLQQRFGDSGHGFVLVAKPWAWYQHRGIEVSGSGWQISPASHFEAHAGLFGLGGVSFTASRDARTRIQLEDPGQTSFELYYLKQPGGGTVAISADGSPVATMTTEVDAKAAGFYAFTTEEGASELELRTK